LELARALCRVHCPAAAKPLSGCQNRVLETILSEALKQEKNSGGLGETVSVLIQALLIAIVIRTLLFQPFSIPSGSMRPTLLEGDYLFTSKFSYGFSRYSFPFAPPLFEGRIWAGAPERGDIAVFKLPSNTKIDYIKRVIGLPGDRIQMIGGALHINGEAVKREKLDSITNFDVTEVSRPVDVYKEILPNGVTYSTLDVSQNAIGDDTREFVVPAGHYFMMGDNRDNSIDSRFNVGFVPVENFIGKANIIFFSVSDGASPMEVWRWPSVVRLGRLFSSVNG
jgi:signal peptidase I